MQLELTCLFCPTKRTVTVPDNGWAVRIGTLYDELAHAQAELARFSKANP